jgi:DNA polymerase beta
MSFQENVEYILLELEKRFRKDKDTFRANAYRKALNIIKGLKLETPDDVIGVKGIGKGIIQKIDEIYNTGKLESYGIEVQKHKFKLPTVDMVYGIGPEKAKFLETHNIKTVDELKKAYEEGREKELKLTTNQIIGLRYFDDIEKKIPRAEIDKYNKILSKALSGCVWQIAGSYRRGKSESGDIDVLVKSNGECLSDVFEKIKKSGIVVEILAKGKKKIMGITRLNDKSVHRRMDILIIDDKYYYASLLYFTGSQAHNIKMRKFALDKGYTLNEYGYTVKKNAQDKEQLQKQVDEYEFDSEKSMFDFIGMDYVEPINR